MAATIRVELGEPGGQIVRLPRCCPRPQPELGRHDITRSGDTWHASLDCTTCGTRLASLSWKEEVA